MPPDGGRVAAIVVAYNGGADLAACVASLARQTVAKLEVIVVDNASTDGSIEALEAAAVAGVRTIRLQTNRGYAAGANVGWRATSAPMIVVLNQDLELAPDCIARMRAALLDAPGEALVTPKLVLRSDPSTVNAVGNDVHLSGVASCRGSGTPAGAWRGVHEVPAISGAAFTARRTFLETLGGLEEAYFMYMEDVDLSIRARAAGAICLAACDAVATHDWSLRLTPAKFGFLERNRGWMWERLLAADGWRARPIKAQVEAMGWAYALLRGPGHVHAKARRYARPEWTSRAAPIGSLEAQVSLSEHLPYDVLFPRSAIIRALGRRMDTLATAPLRLVPGTHPAAR